MSNPKSPKIEFTEEHINYIFNYLNDMYSDRLNNLEKLVTRNTESLHSLKKDLENLGHSLNSLSFLNNYKINSSNSLSSNFSDFFHNFIAFNNDINQSHKTQSKSVENSGLKSPTNLKPALKTTPKAAEKKIEPVLKTKEESEFKEKKEGGFKLLSPKFTSKEEKNVMKHKKAESTSTAKNFTSLKTPIITPTSQKHKSQKTPQDVAKVNLMKKNERSPSIDHDKNSKKLANSKNSQTYTSQGQMKKEILDFKKLLIKPPQKNTQNNEKTSLDPKGSRIERNSRSNSKDRSYQKGTRSSLSKTRPTKDVPQNTKVNYSNLINSVNEFLDFPELDSSNKKSVLSPNNKKPSPKNFNKNLLNNDKVKITKVTQKPSDLKTTEKPQLKAKGASIIEGLEKHCDNINKLYDEVLNITSTNQETKSFNDSISKNTSLAKIVDKHELTDFSENDKRKCFSPQEKNTNKFSSYQVKVHSSDENPPTLTLSYDLDSNKPNDRNQLSAQKDESLGVLDDEESNVSRDVEEESQRKEKLNKIQRETKEFEKSNDCNEKQKYGGNDSEIGKVRGEKHGEELLNEHSKNEEEHLIKKEESIDEELLEDENNPSIVKKIYFLEEENADKKEGETNENYDDLLENQNEIENNDKKLTDQNSLEKNQEINRNDDDDDVL